MKNAIRFLGIIAVTAVFGFFLIACDNGSGGGSSSGGSNYTGDGVPVTFVEANPAKGFNYGYYYYVPRSLRNSSKHFLLVFPNNSGGVTANYTIDDANIHEAVAEDMLVNRTSWVDDLGCVALVPAIPRPKNYIAPPRT